MLKRLPRLVAILCVVWGIGVGGWIHAEGMWSMSFAWLLSAALLWFRRSETWGALLVVSLCGLTFLLGGLAHYEGLHLLTWIGSVITVTAERPQDRDRLTRWLATSVYAFAALTKLNPTWLSGDDLTRLLTTRQQLAFAVPVTQTEIFAIIPVAVIAVEAFLSIALWLPRLRNLAIVLGVTTHLAFVVGAADNPLGFCHLLLINGGLVACYPAFQRLEAPG